MASVAIDEGDVHASFQSEASAGENVRYPLPQVQQGFKQSDLCLNLCSLGALNFKRILVRYLIPSISEMLYMEFFTGFII